MSMVIFMMEIGGRTRRLDMGRTFTIMARGMKVNGSTITSMVLESRLGLMAVNMRETTNRARRMERENIHGKMAVIIPEIGLITKSLGMGFTYGRMEERTKETG